MKSISCYERRTVTLMCPHCYNLSITDYDINFGYSRNHKLHTEIHIANKEGKFKNGLDEELACDKCKGAEPIILDPRIANTVMILNKKGFNTRFSCDGHKYSKTETAIPYIVFDESVPIDIFRTLPKGWRLDVDGDFISIVKSMLLPDPLYPEVTEFPVAIYYHPAETVNGNGPINFSRNKLETWARHLPSMKEYEGEHSENTTRE